MNKMVTVVQVPNIIRPPSNKTQLVLVVSPFSALGPKPGKREEKTNEYQYKAKQEFKNGKKGPLLPVRIKNPNVGF